MLCMLVRNYFKCEQISLMVFFCPINATLGFRSLIHLKLFKSWDVGVLNHSFLSPSGHMAEGMHTAHGGLSYEANPMWSIVSQSGTRRASLEAQLAENPPSMQRGRVTAGQTMCLWRQGLIFPLIRNLLSLRQWHFDHLRSLSEYSCPEVPGQPWVENKFRGHWTTMSRMLFNCSITSPVPGDTGDMCYAYTFVYRSSCVHSVPPCPRVQFLSRWCPCPSRITSLLHFLATCSHSQLLAPAGFIGGSSHWWNYFATCQQSVSFWNACLQEQLSSNVWGMLKDKNCSSLIPWVKRSKVE